MLAVVDDPSAHALMTYSPSTIADGDVVLGKIGALLRYSVRGEKSLRGRA